MSEQKVPRSVKQRIVIKFLVGENVPSAEIYHRLQQQYGEECLLPLPSGVCLEAFIRNLHETYQCRMYSRKLLMMNREDARNM